MMIRINLLPTRQGKKREMGQQVLVLLAAVLVFGLVLNYIWYSSREGVRVANVAKITDIEAQIRELQDRIGEVDKLNARKKEVEEKLKVLDELKKGRSGPVRLMDALATATPKKVWLTDFDEKSNAVKVTGSAVSHDDVAELMRTLGGVVWTPKGLGRLVEQKKEAKTSRVELIQSNGEILDFPVNEVGFFFTNIDLKRAEQRDFKGEGGVSMKIVDFEISFAANYAI